MTSHHSTITSSLNGIFTNLPRAAIQYFEYRAQKARRANDIKFLKAMDAHMQNDIGLPNFNRLAPAQQESLLLETIKHG
jgi:hypothetical protein